MSLKATNNKLVCPVDISGLDETSAANIEEIISKFEKDHEQDALSNGDGWVPRMKPIHYALAIIPNVCFAIWLILAYTL